MKRLSFALCVLLLAGQIVRGQESPGPALSPLTARETWQAVAQELRSRGMREEELPQVADLGLPAALPAREKRTLWVSAVCRDEDAGSVRFRVECREGGACLPFLTDWRGGGERVAAPSCRLKGASRRAAARPRAAPSVVAGERATAVMTAAGLRMTAEVICLDRGASGEIVRVRAKEGRIFRARVSGPGFVEALAESMAASEAEKLHGR